MPLRMVQTLADKDLDTYDKYHHKAYARAVGTDESYSSEPVVVDVTAKDEKQARQKGALLIKAKGRVPPNSTITVPAKDIDVKEINPKGGLYRVTGTRQVLVSGKTIGWFFYGMFKV